MPSRMRISFSKTLLDTDPTTILQLYADICSGKLGRWKLITIEYFNCKQDQRNGHSPSITCRFQCTMNVPVSLLDRDESPGDLLGEVHVAVEPFSELLDQARAVPRPVRRQRSRGHGGVELVRRRRLGGDRCCRCCGRRGGGDAAVAAAVSE